MINKKKILLGVTGGIAAYKAVDLASRLIKEGAEVKVVMTRNATEFVSPLTFKSITNNSVSLELFNTSAPIEHISLSDWADMIVIAPATANIIGKIASGIADDLISTVVMATTSPVLFVPAMNVKMYDNKIVKMNIKKLMDSGYFFMEPEVGRLACGYSGKGRFPQTAEIIYFIRTYLYYQTDLTNLSILVTAGGCEELIDPMRTISNKSSGKMGLSIARACHIRGASVTLIKANTTVTVPNYILTKQANTAQDMLDLVMDEIRKNDVIIMAAAVTDYKPVKTMKNKIKKEKNLTLELTQTTDVLKNISKLKDDLTVVGFAAETDNVIENAKKKLIEKNMDLVIANSLEFLSKDENIIFLINKKSTETYKKLEGNKFYLAHKIIDELKKI